MGTSLIAIEKESNKTLNASMSKGSLNLIRNEADAPAKKNDKFHNYPVYNSHSSELLDGKIGIVSNNKKKEGIFLENPEMKIENKNKITSCSSRQVGIEDPLSLIDQIEKITIATSQVSLSPEKPIITGFKKKLLILDLNGFLADVVYDPYNGIKAERKVGRNSVFKRPFCDDFLRFIFERFNIGVWSSRMRKNADGVVDYVMAGVKHKLLFLWDQSKCTDTGFKTIQDKHKPLFLKELSKLWNKEDETLPWENGAYNPSNTLLLDDSPYKAICNPVNTAIFPYTYRYTNVEDNSLGPDGDIRKYLEGLTLADDVQQYVHDHPFGQSPITAGDPSWPFYLKVIKAVNPSFVPLHNSQSSQLPRPSLATTSKSIHHPLAVATSDKPSNYETDFHAISNRNSFGYSHSVRTENPSLTLSQPIENVEGPRLHNRGKITTEDPSWRPSHHSPVKMYPARNNAVLSHRRYSVASRNSSSNQNDTPSGDRHHTSTGNHRRLSERNQERHGNHTMQPHDI